MNTRVQIKSFKSEPWLLAVLPRSSLLCAWTEHVCSFFLNIRNWHADSRSFLGAAARTKQSIWIFTFSLAKAVHCINPSPSSVLLVSSHSPSLTSLRPKPHSWPNMAWSHQSEALEFLIEALGYFSNADGDVSRDEEEARVALQSVGMEETPRRWMRDVGRHHRSVRKELSVLGLVWSHRTWASQPSPWAEPT